jgi:tetratricopeptide (TPR) repeat protein
MSPAPETCPDDILSRAIGSFGQDQTASLAKIESLLHDYPRDGRLLFLKGSLLAGLERYAEARAAMTAAVEILPDYALARFQLGFLELTSGEPGLARTTWRPLQQLAEDHPLRLFARGLDHMIDDHFAEAVALLRRGIDRNPDIAPLNHDMQLIIGSIEGLTVGKTAPEPQTVSAAHLLLQQYGAKSPTKH